MERFLHSVTFKKRSTKQYIQCAIKKKKENKTTSKSIFLIFFQKSDFQTLHMYFPELLDCIYNQQIGLRNSFAPISMTLCSHLQKVKLGTDQCQEYKLHMSYLFRKKVKDCWAVYGMLMYLISTKLSPLLGLPRTVTYTLNCGRLAKTFDIP